MDNCVQRVVEMRRALRAWQQRASRLRLEVNALYLVYRDPRTPPYARLLAACVMAYALSPVDLIPDFIPVLGHLDDLVLVPLGIALTLRMIPAPVLTDCRAKAQAGLSPDRPASGKAVATVFVLWLLLAALVISLIVR
jgi:uncharacterized membrane protein YkvA (DUF1232 family)